MVEFEEEFAKQLSIAIDREFCNPNVYHRKIIIEKTLKVPTLELKLTSVQVRGIVRKIKFPIKKNKTKNKNGKIKNC